MSGCRNCDITRLNAADLYFPVWAFPKLETDEFMEVVDPSLTGIVDRDEVKTALRVAFLCINDNPQLRPSMSEVVKLLQGVRDISLPVPAPQFLRYMNFATQDNQSSSSHSSTQRTAEKVSERLLTEEQEFREIGRRWEIPSSGSRHSMV